MIIAESVAFLPTVLLNCCTGWMACTGSFFFQDSSCVVVQSP